MFAKTGTGTVVMMGVLMIVLSLYKGEINIERFKLAKLDDDSRIMLSFTGTILLCVSAFMII